MTNLCCDAVTHFENPRRVLKRRIIALLAAIPLLAIQTAVAASAKTTQTKSQGNPIRPMDTADPGVVRADGKWYVYHTSSGYYHKDRYPILVSDDLTSWTAIGHILPADKVPAWASKAYSWWAPEVHKIGDHYVAYYTTREDSTNRFVVGAATAPRPEGPFTDVGHPIVRNETVGLIDVSYFHDPKSGKGYLIWKEDGNDFDPPHPTPLMMSEMTSDGLSLTGPSKELLRNDQPWEGVLVEAPNIVLHNGWYYLFYSGNIFTSDAYSVGVARSRNLWGPYEKQPKPILVHNKYFSGPAHQFVIQDEKGAWHMFYHARLKDPASSRRYLMHDMITWGTDGWPHINDGHPGGPLNRKVVREIQEQFRLYREAARARRAAATSGTADQATTETLLDDM